MTQLVIYRVTTMTISIPLTSRRRFRDAAVASKMKLAATDLVHVMTRIFCRCYFQCCCFCCCYFSCYKCYNYEIFWYLGSKSTATNLALELVAEHMDTAISDKTKSKAKNAIIIITDGKRFQTSIR